MGVSLSTHLSAICLTGRVAGRSRGACAAAGKAAAMTGKIAIGASDVLVVVDVQNDFCPGGRLAVPHGDEVVAPINRLAAKFAHVVLTQDWHPAGHLSFASSHPGRQPFESITVAYGPQVLWPDHCVQGTQARPSTPRSTFPTPRW